MKLFQTTNGVTFAFGFDMVKRQPSPCIICWNDPSGDWEPKPTNVAGFIFAGIRVAPEFIFEVGGRVCAYQPGLCIELTFIGGPLGWSCSVLRSDQPLQMAA